MSPTGAKDITVPDRGGDNSPVCSANKVINQMREDFIAFAAAESLHTPTQQMAPTPYSTVKVKVYQFHTTAFTAAVNPSATSFTPIIKSPYTSPPPTINISNGATVFVNRRGLANIFRFTQKYITQSYIRDNIYSSHQYQDTYSMKPSYTSALQY
jgi:hypothetical protein